MIIPGLNRLFAMQREREGKGVHVLKTSSFFPSRCRGKLETSEVQSGTIELKSIKPVPNSFNSRWRGRGGG